MHCLLLHVIHLRVRIRDIEYSIASKREMAKVLRLDRIVQIQEAASTAFLLGIKDRVDTTNVVQNNQLNITTTSTPLTTEYSGLLTKR